MSFCVIATFKNESEIMEEWLTHYVNEGCEKFYLIDNGSTDNYQDCFAKYSDMICIVNDPTIHGQPQLYNTHFLDKIHIHKWVVLCDLDEFIYSRRQYKTMKTYLESLEDLNISEISIPWKMFGANGFNTLESKGPASVIKYFTKRTDYNKNNGFQGVKEILGDIKMILCKSIVKSETLQKLDIHFHHYSGSGSQILSNNDIVLTKNSPFVPTNESLLEYSCLHLNHYAIRSLDWFCRTKIGRCCAASSADDNVRTLEYYHAFDVVSNDIDDFELNNKSYF